MKPFPVYPVILTASFVALDITGKIDWAWWQVTMPTLVSIVLAVLGALLSGLPSAPENGDKR